MIKDGITPVVPPLVAFELLQESADYSGEEKEKERGRCWIFLLRVLRRRERKGERKVLDIPA